MDKHIDYFHKERKPRHHNPSFLSFDFSLAVQSLDIPHKPSYIGSYENSSFSSPTPQPAKTKDLSTFSAYGNSILTPIRVNKDPYEEINRGEGIRSHLPKQYKSTASSIFGPRASEESMFSEAKKGRQNLQQNSSFGYYQAPSRVAGLRAQYFDELTHLH